MSRRKKDILLPSRPPTFVSREIGAAELCVSPDTWDRMVAIGELPKAHKRLMASAKGAGLPRWEWSKVVAHLNGESEAATMPRDLYVVGAEGVRGPSQGKRSA